MNSLLKKIISSAMIVTCAAFLMGPGAAQALTAAELQVQINALLAQLSTLQSQLTTLQGGTATPGACSGITFSSNLSQGMSGSDVKCLQAILNQSADTQVAASGVGSAGNETLYFGALTKAAVVKFQEKYASEVLTPIGLTAGTGFVGAKTIAKLNSLLVSAPPVTPPVVGVPLSVALTADSPAAANLQKGTANNVLAKFTFTGSDTADTYVTGLTLKHYGNAADATITAKIFDENDIQVGTDRSVVGGLSSFVLVPALVVPKNGTKTISIAANIGSGAETLTTVQFGIDAASSIVGAAFTGSYPIKGNVFTIVPAGTLGSITLGDYANPPKLAVKIGEKDIILESFIVSAGSREDVLIKQITIDNASGTNVDSDITNIRIREVGGAVVAGPVNLLNRKATLNLSSSVLLTKGTSKKFEVVGDIVTGKTRQIGIKLLAGSIIGVGQTSGVNIVNTGATGANLITIESGALVVSQSNSHPSGTSAAFIKTVNSKALAVFSVRAAGEVVMIDTIGLTFTPSTVYSASTNYLRSVGLYDGDTLISDLKDTIAATATQTFTLNWQIPADTVKDLTVKGITNNLVGNETIITAWVTGSGYGLSSGETVSYATGFNLTAITVYPTGTYTLALDTLQTPLFQGVLTPGTNILLGSISIRAQREDMKLYSLILTASNTAASTSVASITLYDSNGTTQLSYPKTQTAGTFTLTSADFLTNIVFQKDVYKTIFVKGNPIATNTDAYSLKIPADAMVLVGADSQANATNTLTSLANTFQGQFYFGDKILEAKKNVTSPSGTIARGSVAVYAIWDISNPTSGDLPITSLTLTSKVGLPSGVATSTAYFSLVDEYDQPTGLTASTSNSTVGTVTFTGSMNIPAASSKSIKLRVNTTNATIWPLGTQMQWSIYAAADMTVTGTITGGAVGWGGTVWSIPADANIVTLP